MRIKLNEPNFVPSDTLHIKLPQIMKKKNIVDSVAVKPEGGIPTYLFMEQIGALKANLILLHRSMRPKLGLKREQIRL